jgi:hypothetical protein
MNPNCIRSKIAAAGTSQTAIAKYLAVQPGSVAKVIEGKMRSLRIEAELSKIVGQTLFPGPRRKPGRPKTVWNGQIEHSAVV